MQQRTEPLYCTTEDIIYIPDNMYGQENLENHAITGKNASNIWIVWQKKSKHKSNSRFYFYNTSMGRFVIFFAMPSKLNWPVIVTDP